MSRAGELARAGGSLLLVKILAPVLVVTVVMGLVVAMVFFLLINGAGGGAGVAEQQRVSNASGRCTITGESTGEGENPEALEVPEKYREDLRQAAEVAGVPYEIGAAQIYQESKWVEDAGSHAGARGLAQFMPETWKLYGEGGEITDGHDSIAAWGRYMAALKDQMRPLAEDDAQKLIELSLAAYNAGPGAVLSHRGVPPFNETQTYVEVITSNAQMDYSEDCKQVPGGTSWDGDLGDGEWTSPCPGCVFTSGFGPRNVPGLPSWAQSHVGVDLASPGAGHGDGGPIIAPTEMKVVGFLREDGCVITRQEGAPGFGFAFCHLNQIDVSEGQELARGDVIGVEGNHAGSVGGGVATHLHFEMYKPDCGGPVNHPYDGCNIDPEPILKEKGAWVQ